MSLDRKDAAAFYRTGPGRRAATKLAQAIASTLSLSRTSRLLAFGHCAPLMAGFDPASVERLVLATPCDGHAITPFASGGFNHAVAVESDRLPFTDALFDYVVVMHGIEHAAYPRVMLREFWRVIAPGGRLVLVVPNRAGLWVHFESTPFGEGRPFGRGQLRRLLDDAMFDVESWQTVLAMPPLKLLQWIDRPLLNIAPGFGGLHLVRAVKCEGARPMMIGKASGHKVRKPRTTPS